MINAFSLLTLVAPESAREWAAFSCDGGETRDITPLTDSGYASSAATTNGERENVPCQGKNDRESARTEQQQFAEPPGNYVTRNLKLV